MNRHQRRRTAARARRTGYVHRILGGLGGAEIPLKPGVHLATIEHDHDCAIYRGGDCNCVPDISVSHPTGDVTVIDQHGHARKVLKQ